MKWEREGRLRHAEFRMNSVMPQSPAAAGVGPVVRKQVNANPGLNIASHPIK